MESQESQNSRKLKSLSDLVGTCAYFGFFDCDCCKPIIQHLKTFRTRTFDINEPSTSADADFLNLNIDSEERKLEEQEENIVLTSQSLSDEDIIDVVNDVSDDESCNEETNEEVDVVNINEPLLDKSAIEFDENSHSVVCFNKTNVLRLNFSKNQNVIVQNEEEIDAISISESNDTSILSDDNVVSVSFEENATMSTILPDDEPVPEIDDDAPLSTYLKQKKRRKLPTQLDQNTDDEIIDVVSIVELPDFEDPTEDTIEVTDSPRPKILKEINVDVEGSVKEKVNVGPCPICLQEMIKSEVMSTTCGHVFCSSCIKSVLKTIKKCPTCRKNLKVKSIHPLFF